MHIVSLFNKEMEALLLSTLIRTYHTQYAKANNDDIYRMYECGIANEKMHYTNTPIHMSAHI